MVQWCNASTQCVCWEVNHSHGTKKKEKHKSIPCRSTSSIMEHKQAKKDCLAVVFSWEFHVWKNEDDWSIMSSLSLPLNFQPGSLSCPWVIVGVDAFFLMSLRWYEAMEILLQVAELGVNWERWLFVIYGQTPRPWGHFVSHVWKSKLA